MLDRIWPLGKLPLSCLGSQVDVVILARVLIEVGNPSLRQRWRRSRASSCEIRRHCHDLSMLTTGLWPGIICKCRVTLIMRSCGSKACSGGGRGCGRSCSYHCVFSWRYGTSGHRGWSSGNRSSYRRLISLLWPLFLIWIRGSSARIHAGVSWWRRTGAQALEILFQNTDLSWGVDLILRRLLLLLLLRRRAADWMLWLRG